MKKSVNVVLIILLVCLLGGLGFFSYKLIVQNKKIYVPDFTDKTYQEVSTWCKSLENNPCSFDNDFSDTVEEGKLIYQSISPDAELGDSIKFIFSLGPKIEIVVPTVNEITTKQTIEKWIIDNNITNQIDYIEENNETVDKGNVIRIEPLVISDVSQKIKVYISSGESNTKDDKNSESNSIEVVSGKYINLMEKDFIAKAKELKLSPNHKESKDAYSNTVTKGNIVWHGSGSYIVDETINYGLSLGKKNDESTIIINKGDYVGKTLEEFKKKVESLGLKAEHSENYSDSYSDTIAKGSIDWHGSGEYEKNEVIHYTLSLGKKSESSDTNEITITSGQFVGKSLDDFKKAVEALGLKAEHSESNPDSYSNTILKGYVDWHGKGIYEKGEVIHYTLSLGKKDGSSSEEINITRGQYVGKTLEDFKKTVEALGLKAEHSENYSDDYSDTIAKGSIDWHGSGEYVAGEVIHYTLSLGKKDSGGDTPTSSTKVNISSNQYVGLSVDEFKNKMAEFGLSTNYNSSKDDYSSNVSEGKIVWHNSGTFNEGAIIAYGVSKGQKEEELLSLSSFNIIAAACESSSYDATASKTLEYFGNIGFTNVTCQGRKGGINDESLGIILEIIIDGNSSFSSGKYPKDVPIVVVICNELQS